MLHVKPNELSSVSLESRTEPSFCSTNSSVKSFGLAQAKMKKTNSLFWPILGLSKVLAQPKANPKSDITRCTSHVVRCFVL